MSGIYECMIFMVKHRTLVGILANLSVLVLSLVYSYIWS